MRALIVDDSRAMRMILKRALKECGFVEFADAADGREGLEVLSRGATPEVAFVDWYMPVMSGIEFVRAVRADHQYDAMVVVMVTSETGSDHVDVALAQGADEYVMKPFTPEVLAEKLALVLSGRS
jgi:two-component system chemotaxis response regulator CheY